MSDWREILFRGRTLIGTEWVVGDLSRVVHDDGRCYVFPADSYDGPDFYEVDPDTVGEFTGLTDKNGVKIFAGDIVRWKRMRKYVIGFDRGAFCFMNFGNSPLNYPIKHFASEEIKVIGNIHDNLELLEGGGAE